MSEITSVPHHWLCPFCKKKFKYFEVMDTQENRNESLAVHLYLTHEKELHIWE